ncbi:ROK family protein, partial [Streptomyces sp. NPDC020667]
MKHVIALDVGGTAMKAALIGPDHQILHEARRPTRRDHGPDAVVDGILDLAAELRAAGREKFGREAEAAGVAVPGIVDGEAGTAVYAANLGWRDVPLRDLLTERLGGGTPVALGHDVRTGGLAEGRVGAGRDADRFLFVALGTGIAGAIGIDGRIEQGSHGYAGEIGHISVRSGANAPKCGCGGTGCLETLASAAAVSAAWARVTEDPAA